MLSWDEKFATGLPAIDHQHRRLFEFLNRLQRGISLDPEAVVQDQDLDFLRTYVEVHFASEELCMFRNVCPMAGQNRGAHRAFLRRLAEASGRPNTPESTKSLAEFLESWIRGHILAVDTSLSLCVDETSAEWQGPAV